MSANNDTVLDCQTGHISHRCHQCSEAQHKAAATMSNVTNVTHVRIFTRFPPLITYSKDLKGEESGSNDCVYAFVGQQPYQTITKLVKLLMEIPITLSNVGI